MINGAGLQGDREDGQAVAGRRRLLRLRAAIGPEHSGNRYRPIHPDRVAVLSAGEFAIYVDDAVGAVSWRGVGRPAATIIRGQGRRRRCFELTEDHGERTHRRAGYILAGIATTGHDHHHQYKEENDPSASRSRRERHCRPGELRRSGITSFRLYVDLLALHVAIVSQDQVVPARSSLTFPEKY